MPLLVSAPLSLLLLLLPFVSRFFSFLSFFLHTRTPSPLVEKATAESNTGEQWQAIIDFSDMLNVADDNGRSEAVKALRSRIAHRSPSVVLQTITVDRKREEWKRASSKKGNGMGGSCLCGLSYVAEE